MKVGATGDCGGSPASRDGWAYLRSPGRPSPLPRSHCRVPVHPEAVPAPTSLWRWLSGRCATRDDHRTQAHLLLRFANPCYRRCFVSSAAATTTTAAFSCFSDRHGAVRVLAGCDFCLTRFFTASPLGYFFPFFFSSFFSGNGIAFAAAAAV